MALIDDWSETFDPRIRTRGEEYARQQRVDIVQRDPDDRAVKAVVRGTSTYHVTAEKGPDDDLWCQCDCPYFYDRHEPCKHIWATVVTWQRGRTGRAAVKRGRNKKQPDWRDQIERYRATLQSFEPDATPAAPTQVLYVIDTDATLADGSLAIELMTRQRKRDGDWGKPQPITETDLNPNRLDDANDRRILTILEGAPSRHGNYDHTRIVPQPLQRELVHQMCATGRATLKHDSQNERNLRWDDTGPWRFVTELVTLNGHAQLDGHLARYENTMPLDDPRLITNGGLVFGDDWVAELDDNGAFGWIAMLRAGHIPKAPADQADALAGHLLALPTAPPLDPPAALLAHTADDAPPPTPRPHLVIRAREEDQYTKKTPLLAHLSFDYGEHNAAAGDAASAIFDEKNNRLVPRDRNLERAAVATLYALGFHPAEPAWNEHFDPNNPPFELAARRLDKAVAELALAGWQVEAAGHVHRQLSAPVSLKVASGIDWFELHGEADFDGHTVGLPALLEAVRAGQRLVQLDDGSVGMLPAEWLAQLAPVAELGEAEGDHIRFKPTQAAVIDALLAAQPDADIDAKFTAARQRLREFEKVEAVDPPASFVGELRPYQREGLGWLHFCRDFGFGGCLADDMGLGKTVQVLALLDSRAALRQPTDGDDTPPPPSLAVVPKSLVHNWVAEAARFTPNLRVLDHTGPLRDRTGHDFQTTDLVVTTYGTLRSDAAMFADQHFDYAVLDEAQAIKNAATASAKAARLLRADHRIAMTGTPIENHLGELWSLFEFLNPGMLGKSRAFKRLTTAMAKAANTGAGDEERESAERRRALIAATVAPFVLRRTKEQVAPDLPPRTEQTIDCPMEPAQQKLYDELRDHYRASLLKRVAKDGLNKSKVHVLEALLRLRQAACHPGLIDDSRRDEPSAKLDTLLERLDEVIDEGHKALVFSQFTSLLSIVRDRLDARGTTYEYLDGKTRDRPARIERFQNDPDQKLFLISLKAGGLGLNLTAADYVFLLDPWWNPAAEAQAIDRTHRIGQTRHVFAYRLITPDTVEQKVLELQQSKRDLADAIISADKGPLSGMTGEELEALLS